MKLCKKCILPEIFPGIKFDNDGICQHCRQAENKLIGLDDKKHEYKERFERIVQDAKDKSRTYDVLMAYSGGKDSSYTLKILREMYDLRILALTFDNHFVSTAATRNIKVVADRLDVDSVCVRPPWSTIQQLFSLTAKEDVFSKATLLRASSICTGCIGIVKGLILKTALEMQIPLVAFGWSPGQAPLQSALMKTNPKMSLQTQNVLLKALPENLQQKCKRYLAPESYFDKLADRFPQNIHPLAFFEYDEHKIVEELHALGWKDPKDTDSNSSNCLINAFANQCHINRHGFHPYVWEIANMVRQDIVNREEGIEKIYTAQDSNMVNYAREKLAI